MAISRTGRALSVLLYSILLSGCAATLAVKGFGYGN